MERNGVRLGAVMVTLVAFMLAQNVTAEPVNGIYTCWGGCYNQCVLQTKTASQRLPCYSNCLSNCIPRSPSDYLYYCQIGCSFSLCTPVSYEGARLERCFGNCAKICKP